MTFGVRVGPSTASAAEKGPLIEAGERGAALGSEVARPGPG